MNLFGTFESPWQIHGIQTKEPFYLFGLINEGTIPSKMSGDVRIFEVASWTAIPFQTSFYKNVIRYLSGYLNLIHRSCPRFNESSFSNVFFAVSVSSDIKTATRL